MTENSEEKIRLSKWMAQHGMCSRREADGLIEKGWVLVDGEPMTQLGSRIFPQQTVTLDPRATASLSRSVTILLNKPVGHISGQPEKGKNYPVAISLIRPENHFSEDPYPQEFQARHLQGLAVAGRLDIDSYGLLVFTQDGRVAKHLIGADSSVEKEYLVRVAGEVTEKTLALLCHGLSLDDKPLKPAKVTRLNQDQLKFILKEGRKRQIRRMCEQVGLSILALKRVRIGRVMLGHLPLGQWRFLGPDEIF
jgi:23S rRNA pseudouridine2604 synthase